MGIILDKLLAVKITRIVFLTTLLGGVALLPIAYWPYAPIPFEIPKVWFVHWWIQSLLVLGIVLFLLARQKVHMRIRIVYAVLVFSAIALVASLFGVDIQKSIVGNYYRLDGLTTLFHLTSFALLLSLLWQKRWNHTLAIAIVLGTTITSVVSISQGVRLYIFHDMSLSGWYGAIGSTFGQPKFLTGYILVSLPFTWFVARQVRGMWKGAVFLAVAIQVGALFLTKSWAGVLILCSLVCVVVWERSGKWRNFIFVFALLLCLSIGAFYVVTKQQQRYALHSQGKIVAEGRERIVRKLALSIKERPYFGYGWANVDHAFDASVWPMKFEFDVYLDKAHSHVLEVLTTTGIVGLLAYLSLIFLVGRSLFHDVLEAGKHNHWEKVLFVVFFVFLIHSQTNVISIAEEVIFWLLVGIAASSKKTQPQTNVKVQMTLLPARLRTGKANDK